MALKRFRKVLPVLFAVGFLSLWQWIAGFYQPDQFPAPIDVLKGLKELIQTGTLWSDIGVSLVRFAAAYAGAVVTGIPLGLFLGRCQTCRRAIDPIIQVLRPISPVAWFPLAVLWFGIGSAPAIFIIYLAAFFPILLSTVSAVIAIPPVYFKVASNFGAGPGSVFLRVVIPAAFPGIMVGLHIAIGTGWIHLVAGEMLGAQSGLGYLIVNSRNFLRTDLIMAGMLVVGLLGLAINQTMRYAEQWLSRRWGGVS